MIFMQSLKEKRNFKCWKIWIANPVKSFNSTELWLLKNLNSNEMQRRKSLNLHVSSNWIVGKFKLWREDLSIAMENFNSFEKLNFEGLKFLFYLTNLINYW